MQEVIKKSREEVMKNLKRFQDQIEKLEGQLQEHYKAVEQCKGALELLRAQEAGVFSEESKPEAIEECCGACVDKPEEAA